MQAIEQFAIQEFRFLKLAEHFYYGFLLKEMYE